jgi:tRNA A37 methylthiotransferase MiaB
MRLTGRTEGNKIVNIEADGGRDGGFAKKLPEAGDIVRVKITGAETWSLEGVYNEE